MATLHPKTMKYRQQIKGELRSGATTEQDGPAIFTHVFSTLPVLSLSISCHHVHWLRTDLLFLRLSHTNNLPNTEYLRERRSISTLPASLSHVSDTSYSLPVFLDSVFHSLPFSAREHSPRPALLCQDAIQHLITDTLWSSYIVNQLNYRSGVSYKLWHTVNTDINNFSIAATSFFASC